MSTKNKKKTSRGSGRSLQKKGDKSSAPKLNIARKILAAHLLEGELTPGTSIAITIDQTLTQDATGTMAYLQFEAMGIPRVKTKRSVSYVDHNMLQTGFENADDHRFLQSVAAKYGIYFSRPGNGICHQVHLERFGVPGQTLLGSDSHTPTNGGLGMIAIGAGGLDVAVAMGGGAFHLEMPKIVGVRLLGRLKDWVTAKDVILEMLRRLTVKGGVGKIFEYTGPGVKTLSVQERATICNMGAELGATTSLFPSDSVTKAFLAGQKRVKDFVPLEADPGCSYDEEITIDLSKLVPMIAQPHMPDMVVPVKSVEGTPAQQAGIGSCTNSSYMEMIRVGKILKGKHVHPDCSLIVAPGSKQVLEMMAKEGALSSMIAAGARIAESACGFCIGMGHSPASGSVSVRTGNRNFLGRSGTKDAKIFLASPETAAATALKGKITDPRRLGKFPRVLPPKSYLVDDSMIIAPPANGASVEILRGPNIKPLPDFVALPNELSGEILLKVGDNITTDHILPAGSKILPLRSNLPAISQHTYAVVDENFARRAKEKKGGFIIGGHNYGQGSSREHAALAPYYLGVKFVAAKSFARIHRANLINFRVIPFTFVDENDYKWLEQGHWLEIHDIRGQLWHNEIVIAKNKSNGREVRLRHDLTDRQKLIIFDGGLLNYTRNRIQEKEKKTK